MTRAHAAVSRTFSFRPKRAAQSRLSRAFLAPLCIVIMAAAGRAAEMPQPDPSFRPLRDGYLQTWQLFNDASGVCGRADGILSPGDRRVASFENWWTPASAHTQHNYDRNAWGGLFPAGDIPSAPMNFATLGLDPTDPRNVPETNHWLPEEPGAIRFYMSYSQYDNNDFETYYEPGGAGWDLVAGDDDLKTLLKRRNRQLNGWALGWVTNAVQWDRIPSDDVGGEVELAVFVHNGKSSHLVPDWGYSHSNPQAVLSNDIAPSAGRGGQQAQWHPPVFHDDDLVMAYDETTPVNQAYLATRDDPSADFDTIVESMEVREADPLSMPASMTWLADTPAELFARGETDHAGDLYRYQDAFTDRSTYTVGSSDGGVVAGLAGRSVFDPLTKNWGDQQVIRIDVSPETLAQAGGIDRLIFYDFGAAPGAGQLSPVAIELRADTSRTLAEGQIYWDDPAGERVYFPHNRVYVSQVEQMPGDFDNDGGISAGDIDALLGRVHAGTNDPFFDLDNDGTVDLADVSLLVRGYLGTEFGDATLDCRVDAADLSLLAAHWQVSAGAGWATGDFTGDGTVHGADLSLLAAYWQFDGRAGATGGQPVPEPGSALLLAVGGLVLRRRRTR